VDKENKIASNKQKWESFFYILKLQELGRVDKEKKHRTNYTVHKNVPRKTIKVIFFSILKREELDRVDKWPQKMFKKMGVIFFTFWNLKLEELGRVGKENKITSKKQKSAKNVSKKKNGSDFFLNFWNLLKN